MTMFSESEAKELLQKVLDYSKAVRPTSMAARTAIFVMPGTQ